CRELTSFVIDSDRCVACGKCMKSCPVEAITGERKVPHVIDQEKCVYCGACREVCPFDAVDVE
ncbi:MAG: 4Fe-4S binding protein, partial [Planctomycetota bacterium]